MLNNIFFECLIIKYSVFFLIHPQICVECWVKVEARVTSGNEGYIRKKYFLYFALTLLFMITNYCFDIVLVFVNKKK